MPKKPAPSSRNKRKVTISLDEELAAWIDKNSEPGGIFASFSHAVERGVKELKDEEEGKDDR